MQCLCNIVKTLIMIREKTAMFMLDAQLQFKVRDTNSFKELAAKQPLQLNMKSSINAHKTDSAKQKDLFSVCIWLHL